MILEDFALLASDTARTKAYIQNMMKEELFPKICIVYSDDINKMQEEADNYKTKGDYVDYFDVNMPILTSLNKADIPYILVENKDINSDTIRRVLMGLTPQYLIYSGYGGLILEKGSSMFMREFCPSIVEAQQHITVSCRKEGLELRQSF